MVDQALMAHNFIKSALKLHLDGAFQMLNFDSNLSIVFPIAI